MSGADPGAGADGVRHVAVSGGTPTALVVDGANVVGSVPDGWWRDRPGAAARVHAHLVSAPLPYDRVVLVLEGKARAGVPEGREGTVETCHAPGSGDDEIVDRCLALVEAGHEVALATADRGLVARVADHGVQVVGPRTVR